MLMARYADALDEQNRAPIAIAHYPILSGAVTANVAITPRRSPCTIPSSLSRAPIRSAGR